MSVYPTAASVKLADWFSVSLFLALSCFEGKKEAMSQLHLL
jgi:hypothetical protein